MSRYIFDKIQSSASAQDTEYLTDNKDRWISRKDDYDLELMANATVNNLVLGAKTFVASIKHKDDTYFCFSGLAIPEKLPTGLEETELTPGLFSCVVFCAELQANCTAAQARDVLEQQYRGQPEYDGHSLDQITPFFPAMQLVKLNCNADVIYTKNIDRVAGIYLALGYTEYPLAIDSELKSRLISFFETGAETIPFNLVVQGLLSYSWQTLFLDLYRCLEQLYTVKKLQALVSKIPHNGSLANLAYILEEELSWRPKEDSALASILASTSNETRRKVLSAFEAETDELTEHSPTKCANYIYKLRNSHVHFRPAMKATSRTSQQWNKIILAMCDAVDDIYNDLGEDFIRERA